MELPKPDKPCRKRKTILFITVAAAVDRSFRVKTLRRHDHNILVWRDITSNTQRAEYFTLANSRVDPH